MIHDIPVNIHFFYVNYSIRKIVYITNLLSGNLASLNVFCTLKMYSDPDLRNQNIINRNISLTPNLYLILYCSGFCNADPNVTDSVLNAKCILQGLPRTSNTSPNPLPLHDFVRLSCHFIVRRFYSKVFIINKSILKAH